MNIIDTNLAFRGSMANRSRTNRIIIHHAEASTCSAEDIHRWHLANGWSGAGYHFLVRKDGSIYRLRPEGKVGAHAAGSNSDSIGICFEGNFMTETMPQAQLDAGRELIAQLKSKWGISTVQRHKDVCDTNCPGDRFPFDALVGYSTTETPAQPVKPSETPRPSGWSQWVAVTCKPSATPRDSALRPWTAFPDPTRWPVARRAGAVRAGTSHGCFRSASPPSDTHADRTEPTAFSAARPSHPYATSRAIIDLPLTASWAATLGASCSGFSQVISAGPNHGFSQTMVSSVPGNESGHPFVEAPIFVRRLICLHRQQNMLPRVFANNFCCYVATAKRRLNLHESSRF